MSTNVYEAGYSYAYDAGYRDGSIHYELEHCPACRNVADLQEALEENAKLHELIGYFLRCFHYLCEGCPLVENGACTILEKVEALGIEVPE